jgi:hypothetical protein
MGSPLPFESPPGQGGAWPRFMPWLMSPPAFAGSAARTRRFDVVAAQWRMHRSVLDGLLPECFEPAAVDDRREGLVTVAFADNQGVDFLAGRGYRMASVLIRAGLREKPDVTGDFVVAMFEDDCLPIVFGRELLGFPSLFADISIEDRPDASMNCEASLWGQTLFALETGPLVPLEIVPHKDSAAAATSLLSSSLLGWRAFPAADGGVALGEPLLTPVESAGQQMAVGQEARVGWGLAGPAEIACVAGLLDALRTLSVDRPTSVARSVMSRSLRTDRVARLGPPCRSTSAGL